MAMLWYAIYPHPYFGQADISFRPALSMDWFHEDSPPMTLVTNHNSLSAYATDHDGRLPTEAELR